MRLGNSKRARLDKPDRGFILITILLLLSILSMTAYLAVERSQLSLKSNSNRVAYQQAQANAEESRRLAASIVNAQLTGQALNPKILAGVQLQANVNQLPTVTNASRLNKSGLLPFLSIQRASLQGEVFIMALPGHLNTQGVSVIQHSAYQGAGQGLGTAESFSRYYELRARGIAQSRGTEVSYWTASDYRFVP